MAGPPPAPKRKAKARGVAELLFNPNVKLDPSQVVDQRAPTPMDYARFEDGTAGFVTDPNVGARVPGVGGRRAWIPLPPQTPRRA